ncbi:hypothetical protein L2X99_08260 [Microbacterium sp. KUDC0406]|uniref:hypothetical protein n=1 Tax=Microbacterium sp. KUDC0406 TaxID=2909588 RepID=UPI001F27406B|nr:hypothetical protein [Microbacterium sp. KUDC0406]UJP11479.1 hypothetical protein L2X99_08260 [Microbacterium sp. KUDC0406]
MSRRMRPNSSGSALSRWDQVRRPSAKGVPVEASLMRMARETSGSVIWVAIEKNAKSN